MKCSSPHMGNYYIGFKALFKKLDIDYFPAPPITKRTLELGTRFSPEFVCLPFKINLGNLFEALEKKADVLFQSGGRGACRYGSYLDLQEKILKDLGFKFLMYRLFDSSNIWQTFEILKRLNPEITFKRLWEAIKITLAKIRAVDKLEDLVRRRAAYVENRRELIDLEKEYLGHIDETEESSKLKKVLNDFEMRLNKKVNPDKNPLKVGIIGELYVVMEPYSNVELEGHLIRMGVEIVRPLTLSHMIKEALSLGLLHRHYLKIASPYLKFECCAHANVSVAEAIVFARRGINGIIHIKPHACMPEITAMTALKRISSDYNIPILFLSFDEHTSSTGLKTRLEAFVELLKKRSRCI